MYNTRIRVCQLVALVATHEEGSTEAASQAINSSQPGLSKQRKNFANVIGFDPLKLKSATNRNSGLEVNGTKGIVVIEKAKQILNLINDLENYCRFDTNFPNQVELDGVINENNRLRVMLNEVKQLIEIKL